MDNYIKQVILRIKDERPQLASILNTLEMQFAIPNKEIRTYLSGVFYGILSVLATENVITADDYKQFSDSIISEIFFRRETKNGTD